VCFSRQNYRNNKLDNNKIQKLEEIKEWEWGEKIFQEFRTWDENYKLLKEFIKENNKIPINIDEYKNIKLGNWCAHQRQNYRNSKLEKKKYKNWKRFKNGIGEKKEFKNYVHGMKIMNY